MRETEFFYRLTPDCVLAAVESLGLEPTGAVEALNSLENRVYALPLDEGSAVVAKFYRPGRWTAAQIQEEHDFARELAAAEVPVCAPRDFGGRTLHATDGIHFAVWPRTGGRAADEFSLADLETLGRVLARIHLVGAQRPAPARLAFSADTYVRQPLCFLQHGGFLPAACAERYATAAEQVALLYEQYAAGIPVQRIHGDAHPGNLLRGSDGFFFLDFDDFVMGPAVQDFWMLWTGTGDELRRQQDAFLTGYAQFCDYEASWLRLPEILRAMRWIHYAAWVAKRWADPCFPATFPQFGTPGYWQQETHDLEEQVRKIRAALDPGGAPAATEPELTNKDFFWDWEEK